MTSAIVLPRLSAWVEGHVEALFEAKTEQDFERAFDAFLAKNAVITVNGVDTSRDDYKKRLQADRALEASASVTFGKAVQVDKKEGDDFKAGSVGVYYTATINEKIKVHGASVQRTVTSSLNVVVDQDHTIPHPPDNGIHGFFDPRRVFKLDEVTLTSNSL